MLHLFHHRGDPEKVAALYNRLAVLQVSQQAGTNDKHVSASCMPQ